MPTPVPRSSDGARVAEALPASRVFLGAEPRGEMQCGASRADSLTWPPRVFPSDNPMFSSIRLGDGPLSVYDLYQFRLSAELVVLSGCGTGLSVVVGGDEQLGLVRGLLYAGAHAVLLTLWDAYDGSTAEFMTTFYRQLTEGGRRAIATGSDATFGNRDRIHFTGHRCLIGDTEATGARSGI